MPISADDPHVDDRETVSVAVELRGPVDLDVLVSAAARHAASCHAAVDVVAVAPQHAILHLTHRGAGPLGPLHAIAESYAAQVTGNGLAAPSATAVGHRPHADVAVLYATGVAARTLSLTTSRLVRACARRHGVDVDTIVSAAHIALAASSGAPGAVITPDHGLADLVVVAGAQRSAAGRSGDDDPHATTRAELGPVSFGDVCGDVFVLGRSGSGTSGIRVYEAAGERIRVDLVDMVGDDEIEATRAVEDRLDGLVEHLQRLAAADLAAPDRTTLGPFDIVGLDGGWQALAQWDDSRALTVPATVADLLDLALARNPEAIAYAAAAEPITYGEIDCRVNQVARSLVAAGVGTDTVVGIMCVDPLWATIATIAVFRSGGGVLPIAVDGPAAVVAELIDTVAPTCVVTDQVLTDADIDPDDVMTELVRHVGVADIVTGADAESVDGVDTGETLARTVFDAIPPWVPTVVLDPMELAERPDDPICPSELSGGAKLDSVAMVGRSQDGLGEPLIVTHGSLAQRLQAAHVPLAEAGSSDPVMSMMSVLLDGRGVCPAACGVDPGQNTEAYVLDDCLRLLPVGSVGMLYIGGDHIGRGYAGPSATTSMRHVANPFRPGERMVATDMLVRRNADGSLAEVCGCSVRDVAPDAPTASHTPVGRSGVHRRARGHA